MDWLTLEQARSDHTALRNLPEAELRDALETANDWATARVRPLLEGQQVPPSVRRAVALMAARFHARGQSVEGLVGMGESGVAVLPGTDRDAEALIAPYRKRPVFG